MHKRKHKLKYLLILLLPFLVSCDMLQELITEGQDLNYTLNLGEALLITPTFSTPLSGGSTLNWESSDDSIVTIETADDSLSAIVYAKGKGKAIVTISIKNKYSKLKVEITVVKSIGNTASIIGSEGLTISQTEEYKSNFIFDKERSYTWSSSDEEIATIDPKTGMLTAIKSGTVVIRLITDDFESITKEIDIYEHPTSIEFYGRSQYLIEDADTIKWIVNNKDTADQSAVTFTSSNTDIFTVSSSGRISAVSVGTATLTINSTVSDLSCTQTITVRNDILLSSTIRNEYNNKQYEFGYNAFNVLEDALNAARENTVIYVVDGTYKNIRSHSYINKNGITIKGDNATIISDFRVSANIKDLTIEGLRFTGDAQILFSEDGGISNFVFKNNVVYDSTLSAFTAFIQFQNNGSQPNNDFLITNNRFEINTLTRNTTRFIRGGNVNNITITDNYFDGIHGAPGEVNYMDAIRIEGTNQSNSEGIGAAGEVVIANNEFHNIGQRAVWIVRYSATSIQFLDNHINWAGDQSYGGGIQIQTWTKTQPTHIDIKYNTFENINGIFGIRLSNSDILTDDENWNVRINYNKFLNFIPSSNSYYVQTYSENAKNLINADYNYFSSSPVDRLLFVGSVDHQFSSETELDDAIASIR